MSLSYGFVKITGGSNRGRIGYYNGKDGKNAVVCFGLLELGCREPYIIPESYLDNNIYTNELLDRIGKLQKSIYEIGRRQAKPYDAKKHAELLQEYILIEELLTQRYHTEVSRNNKGEKIFLSHSSRDKIFVRTLASDLSEHGFSPCLDEWEISSGEMIPRRVQDGIDSCHYFGVVLSNCSVSSGWIGEEFYTMYGDTIACPGHKVLPILLENCKIPALFRHQKYADFRFSYEKGLDDVINMLNM